MNQSLRPNALEWAVHRAVRRVAALGGDGKAPMSSELEPGSILRGKYCVIRLLGQGAIVAVGKNDVGPTPVDASRSAGTCPLVVQREGYVDYETSLSVKAGEGAEIDAVLVERQMNVAEQRWFWTSIAAAVGSSGWVAQPAAIRF